MTEAPQLTGAPITINQDDGSTKIYDTGLLKPEVQQAVNMLAFTNQIRQVLDGASRLFSNVVTNNLNDEAMVEEIVPEVEAEGVEETEMETVRSRNEEGQFLADDKSTPDVNEAYIKREKKKAK